MIKIIGINRKVSSQRVENSTGTEGATVIRTMDANCNAVMATDQNYNKGHFQLTDEEGLQFDELCQRIEQRIVRDIADAKTGLAAIEPKPQEDQPKAAAASTTI